MRVRVTTRLAWLGISQKSFASAIGMDKSRLSRAIRADSPRSSTLDRIALGLGLTTDELIDSDESILLKDHPAIHHSMSAREAEKSLSLWYCTQVSVDLDPGPRHRSDDERYERRQEVRDAMLDGTFCLEFVRNVAARHGVSHSQIYADRSFLERTEGIESRTDGTSASG